MSRRLTIAALVTALLGVAAPVAHAVVDVQASSRRLACVNHNERGGYCVSNPVPDALDLVDGAAP